MFDVTFVSYDGAAYALSIVQDLKAAEREAEQRRVMADLADTFEN